MTYIKTFASCGRRWSSGMLRFAIFLPLLATMFPTTQETRAECSSLTAEWKERVSQIKWIAYSPSKSDPTKGVEATRDAIRADLAVLRGAGFTGLVTYSSVGILGRV